MSRTVAEETRGPDLSKADLGETQLDLAAKILEPYPFHADWNGEGGYRQTCPDRRGVRRNLRLSFLSPIPVTRRESRRRGVRCLPRKAVDCVIPSLERKRMDHLVSIEFPKNSSPVFLAKAIWNHLAWR